MLVLSRQLGERIVIGEPPNQVTLTIKDIRSNVVRIGVDGPRDVPIYRGELGPFCAKCGHPWDGLNALGEAQPCDGCLARQVEDAR